MSSNYDSKIYRDTRITKRANLGRGSSRISGIMAGYQQSAQVPDPVLLSIHMYMSFALSGFVFCCCSPHFVPFFILIFSFGASTIGIPSVLTLIKTTTKKYKIK